MCSIVEPDHAPFDVLFDEGDYVEPDILYHFGVPEYWVVDPDARAIEVWRLADGATEPEVFENEDTLRWQPVPGAATLEMKVARW